MYAALEKMQANRKMGIRLPVLCAVSSRVITVPSSTDRTLMPKAASRLCRIWVLNSMR